MADAPVPETQSTPSAPAEPPASPPAEPVKVAPSAPEPAKAAEPPAEPAKASEPELKEEPLFTLPEDFKPPESMVSKFTEYAKSLPDKKLAQGVADLYVEMAREANTNWMKEIENTDKVNAASCKEIFQPEELKASEVGVAWMSQFDPYFPTPFKDYAKRQLNDPVFVNLMRIIGVNVQEDSIGRPQAPAPTVDKRPLLARAAEKLYGAKTN